MSEAEDKRSRMWATFCHLSALSFLIGVPLGNILGPLIFWLIKKDEFPFVDGEGKESLNFQISMTIYGFIAFLLCFVMIGFVLLIGLFIAEIVLVILASISANRGESYSYPCTIRFIK